MIWTGVFWFCLKSDLFKIDCVLSSVMPANYKDKIYGSRKNSDFTESMIKFPFWKAGNILKIHKFLGFIRTIYYFLEHLVGYRHVIYIVLTGNIEDNKSLTNNTHWNGKILQYDFYAPGIEKFGGI